MANLDNTWRKLHVVLNKMSAHIKNVSNPHSVTAAQAGALASDADYGDISTNDTATDVTGAELEELTDGSLTSLHTHAASPISGAYQTLLGVTSASESKFVSTIAGGGAGYITYGAVTQGNENCLPTASYAGKIRLHNTTRGDYALIDYATPASNRIDLTDSVPGTWQAGDTITIASQTCNGGTDVYVDMEVVSGDSLDADILFVVALISDSGAVTQAIQLHPFETYGAGKRRMVYTQVSGKYVAATLIVPLTGNVFCLHWDSSGVGTCSLQIREEACQ